MKTKYNNIIEWIIIIILAAPFIVLLALKLFLKGIAKLLKVILTLRDFNYRVFMPDLPLPEYDVNSTEISQTQPIFAQHFNWEVFRYYYQRGLIFGDMLEEYKYNSYKNIAS